MSPSAPMRFPSYSAQQSLIRTRNTRPTDMAAMRPLASGPRPPACWRSETRRRVRISAQPAENRAAQPHAVRLWRIIEPCRERRLHRAVLRDCIGAGQHLSDLRQAISVGRSPDESGASSAAGDGDGKRTHLNRDPIAAGRDLEVEVTIAVRRLAEFHLRRSTGRTRCRRRASERPGTPPGPVSAGRGPGRPASAPAAPTSSTTAATRPTVILLTMVRPSRGHSRCSAWRRATSQPLAGRPRPSIFAGDPRRPRRDTAPPRSVLRVGGADARRRFFGHRPLAAQPRPASMARRPCPSAPQAESAGKPEACDN